MAQNASNKKVDFALIRIVQESTRECKSVHESTIEYKKVQESTRKYTPGDQSEGRKNREIKVFRVAPEGRQIRRNRTSGIE